jgi:hypothetical protein
MFDDFDTQVQCEERIDFFEVLAEMIYSLPENEREEIIAELMDKNHGLKNP